ncbi:methyl-accepting chemotaxis protein [Sulfurirhabdus autotrophica]|uniref:Methyl-accepting chemotaxis sensory transducer with Pas/Pac sensor n=1 Tax=Sulfurirhabdus autotrophica TaxID=1706046 RepID=A0A4R3YCT2_9PROT|nr:PAS domain-containing methyl-accepting chemotaxis protein [Sulfurirhabdus autotrophica]TCV89661.1 methyl-accepting chemotaxis sensory transducer with Pas/Pac sensor [Sulfurirhabdus autotrophica]
MKINMPVTQKEQPYPRGKILVSKTDTKGTITYVNDIFIEISGFSQDELVGRNHNIVRHPDMPQEAFADLWSTVKKGRPWRGLVKNRCKNGDYYWVEALVVPVRENNEIIGYMSVRKEPDRQQVNQAEALYKAIREKQTKLKRKFRLTQDTSIKLRISVFLITFTLLLLVAGLAGLSGSTSAVATVVSVGSILAWGSAFFMSHSIVRPLKQAVQFFDQIAQGNLNNAIPVDRLDETGQVLSSLAYTQAHLRVITDEIRLASLNMKKHSVMLQTDIEQVASHLQEQQDRVIEVSAAMEEVTVSISEVAKSADEAASAATTSLSTVKGGSKHMNLSMVSTGRLVTSVQESSNIIDELSKSIQKVGLVTQVIKDIADRTNLLALNAAIEAARAGEQGRGFAVVADEVRQLAERTTISTADIASIVEEIQVATQSAVASMDKAALEVGEGRSLLQETSDSFLQITGSSEQVNEIAQHIASAANEQSTASEQVAINMEKMSSLIEKNNASISGVTRVVTALAQTAGELQSLVAHFEKSLD